MLCEQHQNLWLVGIFDKAAFQKVRNINAKAVKKVLVFVVFLVYFLLFIPF
jgi:hypothetical protein